MKKSRQKKTKKELPDSGGGGIEGLVFVGGALAVAGLIAAFTFSKRRKVDESKINIDPAPIELLNEFGMKEMEDVRSKQLQSALPIPNQPLNQNTSVNDANGENMNSENSDHEETLHSDTEQESISISEDYCVAEESHSPLLLPVPDSASESMNQLDEESSMESSFSSSTDDEEDEQDSSFQSSSNSSSTEEEEEEDDEISSIQSTKEDYKDAYDEEKSEESSQSSSEEYKVEATDLCRAAEDNGSGENISSSMESNLEELLSESKETDLCPKFSGEEECRAAENYNGDCENMRTMGKNKIENEVIYHKRPQPHRMMTRKYLVYSVLVLMVLCLLTNLVLSFYLPSSSTSNYK